MLVLITYRKSLYVYCLINNFRALILGNNIFLATVFPTRFQRQKVRPLKERKLCKLMVKCLKNSDLLFDLLVAYLLPKSLDFLTLTVFLWCLRTISRRYKLSFEKLPFLNLTYLTGDIDCTVTYPWFNSHQNPGNFVSNSKREICCHRNCRAVP